MLLSASLPWSQAFAKCTSRAAGQMSSWERPNIFVRWKPLSEQPIGWNPDLNDGVRMNIRPFIEARILRKPPNIKWTKDRGNEPQRPQEEYPWFWPDGTFKGERVNDRHYTNAKRQAARKRSNRRHTPSEQ